MSTQQAWRTFSYEVSEALAPTWSSRRERIETIAEPVREWMLRELDPQPGETVLELAAGTGDTGFEAARLVGERGHVISSDFAPAMVETARRRGAELGLGNVEYRVLDAERIELEPDAVDRVVCRYAYMLMADAAAALAETRRVLRPGGRLTLAVWGPPERNPFFTLVAAALVDRGLIPPDPEGPGLFSLASAERLTALLERSGFATSRLEEVPVRFHCADVDDYLDFVADTAGPIALALRRLGRAEVEGIRAEIEPAVADFGVADGFELPGLTLAAVAS